MSHIEESWTIHQTLMWKLNLNEKKGPPSCYLPYFESQYFQFTENDANSRWRPRWQNQAKLSRFRPARVERALEEGEKVFDGRERLDHYKDL